MPEKNNKNKIIKRRTSQATQANPVVLASYVAADPNQFFNNQHNNLQTAPNAAQNPIGRIGQNGFPVARPLFGGQRPGVVDEFLESEKDNVIKKFQAQCNFNVDTCKPSNNPDHPLQWKKDDGHDDSDSYSQVPAYR